MTTNQGLLRTARDAWGFLMPPMDMGIEDGIVWAICRSRFCGVNGYAMIPAEGHPWSNGLPNDVDKLVTAPGGLTCHGLPWIGFDTGHTWDIWPAEYDPEGLSERLLAGLPSAIHWTVEMVADAAKSLARQVAAIGETSCRAGTIQSEHLTDRTAFDGRD